MPAEFELLRRQIKDNQDIPDLNGKFRHLQLENAADLNKNLIEEARRKVRFTGGCEYVVLAGLSRFTNPFTSDYVVRMELKENSTVERAKAGLIKVNEKELAWKMPAREIIQFVASHQSVPRLYGSNYQTVGFGLTMIDPGNKAGFADATPAHYIGFIFPNQIHQDSPSEIRLDPDEFFIIDIGFPKVYGKIKADYLQEYLERNYQEYMSFKIEQLITFKDPRKIKLWQRLL